jgi:hypothetical protein
VAEIWPNGLVPAGIIWPNVPVVNTIWPNGPSSWVDPTGATSNP